MATISVPAQGNIINRFMERAIPPVPTVGMAATMTSYSDRHAGTVIEVSPSGKTIKVQEDLSIRTDDYGMSDIQSYTYERNPNGQINTYRLRKNGRYVLVGCKAKSAQGVALGIRDSFHDYTF